MFEIYDKKLAARDGEEEEGGEFYEMCVIGSSAITAKLEGDEYARYVAVHGRGAEQRVAFSTWSADPSQFRVHILNVQTGEVDVSIQPRQETAPHRQRFGGVAFNRDGDLFVSCRTCIDVYDRAGGFVRSIGGPASSGGKFGCVAGIAFTPGGDLVVADNVKKFVHVVRKDGTFVRSFGSKGKGEGQFGVIVGVAVWHDGSIAVADYGNHRVQVFDGEGRYVRSIGCEGEGEGKLQRPEYVAIGIEGEVIVSDFARKEVLVFSKEGKLLQSVGKGGSSVDALKYPRGVAVDGDGRLYVAATFFSNAPPDGPGRGIRVYTGA